MIPTVYGSMFDSATHTFPEDAQLKALYINGRFASRPIEYKRGQLWIDVLGNMAKGAFFADVESGDISVTNAGSWLDSRGMPGGIYCDRDNLPRVLSNTGTRKFSLWLATLDGTINVPDIPSRVTLVAVQAFGAKHLGFNADMSLVTDYKFWKAHAINA
jgi:hypothetical protein